MIIVQPKDFMQISLPRSSMLEWILTRDRRRDRRSTTWNQKTIWRSRKNLTDAGGQLCRIMIHLSFDGANKVVGESSRSTFRCGQLYYSNHMNALTSSWSSRTRFQTARGCALLDENIEPGACYVLGNTWYTARNGCIVISALNAIDICMAYESLRQPHDKCSCS